MKVKCLRNDWVCSLTIGKTYEVIHEYYGDYYLINDDSEEYPYTKRWFKPLSEIRNEIIDKLLN